MKINTVIIAIIVVAILAFVFFIVKRNKKDLKGLKKELNLREMTTEHHEDAHI